jgi:hypothetical protein
MIKFLVIKKLFGLDKNVKKKDPPQNKTQIKEKQKTQNPPSFSLFTFVVLLLVDVGTVGITILLLCFRKWLLSYVPPCPENLERRFITNLPNGIAIGLPTRPLFIEMELEPLFSFS